MRQGIEDSMYRCSQIFLCIIAAVCAGLFCLVHGREQLEALTLIGCLLSSFLAVTLAFTHSPDKKKSRKKKRAHATQAMTPDNVEQAIRIIHGNDDGRRHYENLPRAARRKSMFGGRMID